MLHFIRKLLAGCIDAFITFFLMMQAGKLLPEHIWETSQHSVWFYISAYLLFSAYRLITFSLWNASFGMMIVRLQLLNEDGEQMSFTETLSAAFFIFINGVNYHDSGFKTVK